MASHQPWVVLKFGGTSVASPSTYTLIKDHVQRLQTENKRVWLVFSALSGVTNTLEQAVEQAITGEEITKMDDIIKKHKDLAAAVGLPDEKRQPVTDLLEEARRLLEGIRMTEEASPKLRARMMAFGELASTKLAVAILSSYGVNVRWVDSRDVLTSSPSASVQESDRYLEADVEPSRDPEAVEKVVEGAGVVLSQGFIARTPKGHTCLLGRGGSDTSASLFAALLGAELLEIWTDVHGMFTTDPRRIPSARLIQSLGYQEASELAAMGAKVLHPRCIGPVRWAGVPLQIRNTLDPHGPSTKIGLCKDTNPCILSVSCRTGVTMLSMSTVDMWATSGFLAKIFVPFEKYGISVDLITTSESTISVTLDHVPGGLEGDAFDALLRSLKQLSSVEVHESVAVVSIVGRQIRYLLHEIGPHMSSFKEMQILMLSQSAKDLNMSFVLPERDAKSLVNSLHGSLFTAQGNEEQFGPSYEQLLADGVAKPVGGMKGPGADTLENKSKWWYPRKEEILAAAQKHGHCYVYDLNTVAARASALREKLTCVGARYYAMKANSHPDVVRTIASHGFGMECVSAAEVKFVRETLGPDHPILFTPNFCDVEEFKIAYELGAEVTVDGPHIFPQAPEIFKGRCVAVRCDPGGGKGHHKKVVTAGPQQKFGHPISEMQEMATIASKYGVKITGLHAHVGSGVLEPSAWAKTATTLHTIRAFLPDLKWVDVGGGFGVVERPGQKALDLDAVNKLLRPLAEEQFADIQIRIEPGRYLVSEAGVLVSKVTQIRNKGTVQYVGLATGMNSLIRPSLYGAWHTIHNLSRIDEPCTNYCHVVGPICESGDILGQDRLLPPATAPEDIILIENGGAYGIVMSSSYNMRPANEPVIIPVESK